MVILIHIFALGISSAEIYKWVDENGVTHYSDSPTEDISGSDATESDEIQSSDPAPAETAPSPDENQKGSLDSDFFNFIRNMGNHLDALSEITALAFLFNDRLVDLPGGYGVVSAEGRGREPGIIPQVQVGFRPVIGDKDFAVLVGAHGPRVNIQIWIDFYHADRKPAAFQKTSQGRGRDPFTQAGAHSAGDENILAHVRKLFFKECILSRS